MADKLEVNLYTDGACSGNPGAGGFGAILVYKSSDGVVHEKELSEGYEHTTNNQMELMGVIKGLEALIKPCKLTVTTYSKYVADDVNNNWIDGWITKNWKTSDKKPVKNQELWQRLLVAKEPHDVSFIWVKGHAGHPYNERCDVLAVTAYKGENLNSQVG